MFQKQYIVQVDCLKDSESDSYDKNDMKEKVNDLVRLDERMQKELKTASYLEHIQEPAPKKRKNYHHWNTSSGKKHLWRWQFQ